MDMIQQIKKHFADIGYEIGIDKYEAAGIKETFTHNIVFLKGQSSIRLFRLVKKYFGGQVRVIGTNKTRVLVFHFQPDGHRDITGICKVCGCSEDTLCPGNDRCYWTEQDLCNGCHEVLDENLIDGRARATVPGSGAARGKKVQNKLQEQL